MDALLGTTLDGSRELPPKPTGRKEREPPAPGLSICVYQPANALKLVSRAAKIPKSPDDHARFPATAGSHQARSLSGQ